MGQLIRNWGPGGDGIGGDSVVLTTKGPGSLKEPGPDKGNVFNGGADFSDSPIVFMC